MSITIDKLPWNQTKFAATDYDAVGRDPSQRSNRTKVRVYNEDDVLSGRDRHKLSATAQSLVKNFSLAAWVIRKHLDYVTSFNFQARTDNQDFNKAFETFVKEWSSRHNFDAARRHRLSRAIRMAEARRVVDGDILCQKLSTSPGTPTRGKVQWVEGDRVHNDDRVTLPGTWVNGVRINKKTSQAMGYAICNREKGKLTHSHVLPSRTAFLHAYYDGVHRFDSIRGISPIACALNQLKDTYDGFDLIMAKIRVNQLFGLKITRDETTDGYGGFRDQPVTDPDNVDANTEDESYDVDLSTTKNFLLDMDPGEDADFLESKTPAAETTEFLQLMIQVALKSLDIPMSFFSEDFTNFFGSRAALLHYLRSAKCKTEDNQELLNELTRWRVGLAVLDGELVIPRGMAFDDIIWEWVPEGVPWWDPAKEVRGHKEAIGAGFDSPQNVARINGTDFYENIERIAEAQEYASALGVELNFQTHNPHPRGAPSGEIQGADL